MNPRLPYFYHYVLFLGNPLPLSPPTVATHRELGELSTEPALYALESEDSWPYQSPFSSICWNRSFQYLNL
jgi:hypothetical protein